MRFYFSFALSSVMYPHFNVYDDEKMGDLSILKETKQYNLDKYSTSLIVVHGGNRPGLQITRNESIFRETIPNVIGFRLLNVSTVGVTISGAGVSSIYYITSRLLASATNANWSSIDGVREPIIGTMAAVNINGVYPDQNFPLFWFRNPLDLQNIDLELKVDNGNTLVAAINSTVCFTVQIFQTLTS